MKKILYILMATGLFITSCKQDLDINNPNAPTTAVFWKTATDAQQGVNAVYSTLHRDRMVLWQWFYYTVRSDEAFSRSPDVAIPNNMDKFLITDYNFARTNLVYFDNYVGIFRANQVLDNVPNIQMDEALKNRLIAEAKFLRGFFYFNLASLYGNVPLMLTTSKPTDLPNNKTTTRADVWAQVAKDLTEAAEVLPIRYTGIDVGRATKGAANALLAKVYMQLRQYDKALVPLQWLVEGEGKSVYGLVPNYRHNFLSTTENNMESVFEWQLATNPSEFTPEDTETPNHNYGSPLAQFIAPLNVGFSDAEFHRWVINEFHKEKTTTGARDPRLEASFLYDSTDVRGPSFSLLYGQTFEQRYGLTGGNRNRVWLRKFANDAEPGRTGEGFRSANNYRFIRYADVLLMYAETLNELGRTTDAFPHVNRVRQRVGLAPLAANLNQAQFRNQIMHERVTELAGEGHRWNDLDRWGYFEDQAKMNELIQRDPAFSTFMMDRHRVLPLPQRDVDINPNLVQNPNY